MSYEIKLPLFEGPFDLLLFFIERDEIDIMDIPISKIANDFFEYISELENMNIEVASEFIVVAATLMRIKSKMLLPRPPLDIEGNEIDPRDEATRLAKKERGNLLKEVDILSERAKVETELQDIDLYKLLVVFKNALSKFEDEKNKPKHKIFEYPYTISQQKIFLINLLKSKSKISFDGLIKENPLKILVIYNFLAMLELIQESKVKLSIGNGMNNFWIQKF